MQMRPWSWFPLADIPFFVAKHCFRLKRCHILAQCHILANIFYIIAHIVHFFILHFFSPLGPTYNICFGLCIKNDV